MVRKLVGALLAGSVLAVGAAGTAGAQGRDTLTGICNGHELTVRVAGGQWAAAQIDGGGVLIPIAFRFTATPVAGGETLEFETQKGGAARGHLESDVTCHFSEQFEEDGVLYDVDIHVDALLRPRSR
jgi:hypothetical protein